VWEAIPNNLSGRGPSTEPGNDEQQEPSGTHYEPPDHGTVRSGGRLRHGYEHDADHQDRDCDDAGEQGPTGISGRLVCILRD